MNTLKNNETIDTNTVTVDNQVGGLPPESVYSTDVSQHVEVDGTPTASFGGQARMVALAGLLALGGGTFTVSCTPEDVVNPNNNNLTPDQKLFESAFDPTNQKLLNKGWVKESILDGKPVVCVPVSPTPNNTNFTEAFKGFMDIEIRLIDAKTGQYSITPIIHRSSVEKIIEKGKELEPGKDSYGMSLVCDAINGDIKRSLTTGVSIIDKDDNNSATRAPHIAQLPERFTIDEFRKYYTNGTTLVKTFYMSKSESFRMIMDLATIGQKFDTVVYPVNPSSDALSIVQN